MSDRVVVITGAGGTLGAALSRQFAGEPDTDVVLSDVSAPSLDATVAGLPERARRGRDDARRRERDRRGRSRRRAARSSASAGSTC